MDDEQFDRDIANENHEMSTTKDGGPAFPETRWDDIARQEVQWTGMTLRDWFKGQALAGMMANANVNPREIGDVEIIELCGFFADAMIAAREGGAK